MCHDDTIYTMCTRCTVHCLMDNYSLAVNFYQKFMINICDLKKVIYAYIYLIGS